jgi:hypothetical protein
MGKTQKTEKNSNHPELRKKIEFSAGLFSLRRVCSCILIEVHSFKETRSCTLGFIVFAGNFK